MEQEHKRLIRLFATEAWLEMPLSRKDTIKDEPGYYAIRIKDKQRLIPPFSKELEIRDTHLLYTGIATGSLFQRLIEQELMLLQPATFFRGLGAHLGHRPEPGTLGPKGKNYSFPKSSLETIRKWIDENLEVIVVYQIPEEAIEKELIKELKPIFNWTHNPMKFQPLRHLKKECRTIARTMK